MVGGVTPVATEVDAVVWVFAGVETWTDEDGDSGEQALEEDDDKKGDEDVHEAFFSFPPFALVRGICHLESEVYRKRQDKRTYPDEHHLDDEDEVLGECVDVVAIFREHV